MDPTPSVVTPSFAASLRWSGPKTNRTGPPVPEVTAVSDDESATQTIFTRYYSDERVLLPELGFLINTGI